MRTPLRDVEFLYKNSAQMWFAHKLYAFNYETQKQLIHWRGYITTDESVYITSSAQHEWTMIAKIYKNNAVIETITKTGYFNVNTDINDEFEIAHGVVEMPNNESGSYIYGIIFQFTVKLSEAIVVDVSAESGYQLKNEEYSFFGGDRQQYTSERLKSEDGAHILTANNFNDEENIALTYSNIDKYSTYNHSLDAAISLDGYDALMVREGLTVSKTNTEAFTYNFTNSEREIFRKDMSNQPTKEIYIILTNDVVHPGTLETVNIYRYYVKRTLSIVNANPVLSPVVKDTNATTKALTGNENKIVRFYSNAYVASNVVLQKHAGSVKSHSISVGGKSTTAQTYTFNAVEGNTFTFTATDSRGFNTTKTVKPPFVDYVKITCNIDANPVSADDGTLTFNISGICFSGSFGAVSNNLGLAYRVKRKQDAWGSWVNVASGITRTGNTYTVDISVSGLNYQESYDLQAMATDKLSSITTPIKTLTTIPIFDWGKEDFNFNVPVNFSDSADFKTTTKFQGKATFWNTAEFKKPITTQESTTFNGTVKFNNTIDFGSNGISVSNINTSTTKFDSNNTMADYIVATGTASMGTNGTWYWQKWKSGRAECFGKRNFGAMAITTKKVDDVYRSSTFTQALPSGLFNATPYYISINTCPNGATNYEYCWIGTVGSTAASSTSTGGFCVMSCNSQTASATDITFNVVGTWK